MHARTHAYRHFAPFAVSGLLLLFLPPVTVITAPESLQPDTTLETNLQLRKVLEFFLVLKKIK